MLCAIVLAACTRDEYHMDNVKTSEISPSLGLPPSRHENGIRPNRP